MARSACGSARRLVVQIAAAPPDGRRSELAHFRALPDAAARWAATLAAWPARDRAGPGWPDSRFTCGGGGPSPEADANAPPVAPALISALLAAGCAGVNACTDDRGRTGHATGKALRQAWQHVDAEMASSAICRRRSRGKCQPYAADLQRVVSFEWSGRGPGRGQALP